MIVHRGRGGLIAVIAFLCLLAAETLTRIHFHDNTYYQQHPWPKTAACLLAAFLVWWLSPRKPQAAVPSPANRQWLISSSQDTPPIEPESSAFKVTFFRETDSFFLIPVKYWPLILCAIGVVLYFVPAANLP